MRERTKRPLKERLRGFVQLCHPVPVLFHLLGVTIFALLATWPHPAWQVVLLIVGAHTAMQMAIAIFNDYYDRKRDAVGKPEKPLARGLVTPREALVAVWLMLVLMLVLLFPLPPLAWLISLLYLALGMAYNLGLKSTPLSGIVFALALPLIPLYAFAGAGRSVPFLIWLVPIGFLLGVGLNLANSLPDLEEDAASGARTLAVVLGVERSFLVGNILLILSALLIFLLHLTGILTIQPLVLATTLSLTAVLLVTMFVLTGARKPRATRTIYFYFVTLACIVIAGGWFIGALI